MAVKKTSRPAYFQTPEEASLGRLCVAALVFFGGCIRLQNNNNATPMGPETTKLYNRSVALLNGFLSEEENGPQAGEAPGSDPV